MYLAMRCGLTLVLRHGPASLDANEAVHVGHGRIGGAAALLELLAQKGALARERGDDGGFERLDRRQLDEVALRGGVACDRVEDVAAILDTFRIMQMTMRRLPAFYRPHGAAAPGAGSPAR
jgi:hypothetical protein